MVIPRCKRLATSILSLGSAPISDEPETRTFSDATYPNEASFSCAEGSTVTCGAAWVDLVLSCKAWIWPAKVSATAEDCFARSCSALGSAAWSYNSRLGACTYRYLPERNDWSELQPNARRL